MAAAGGRKEPSQRLLVVKRIHILLEEVTRTLEIRIPIQVGIRGKTHQVILEQGATQIHILEVILQEDILINQEEGITQTKTHQQEATHQQEDILINQEGGIIQINTHLLEATQQQADTPINQGEGTLTSTQLEGIILINTQGLQDILQQVAILTNTQQEEVISPISTPEEAATQSEQIQGKAGVLEVQVVIQVVIQEVTVVELLVVTPTGTQIIKSSAQGLEEEVMDMVAMEREDLLSLVLCRAWEFSPSRQVLPKKPW